MADSADTRSSAPAVAQIAVGEAVRLRAELAGADPGRTRRAIGVLLFPSLLMTYAVLWFVYSFLSNVWSPGWMASPWFGPAPSSPAAWTLSVLALLGPGGFVCLGLWLLAMSLARMGALPADFWGEILDPESLRVSWPGGHRVVALAACEIDADHTHRNGTVSLTLRPNAGNACELRRLTRREADMVRDYHEAAQRRH